MTPRNLKVELVKSNLRRTIFEVTNFNDYLEGDQMQESVELGIISSE